MRRGGLRTTLRDESLKEVNSVKEFTNTVIEQESIQSQSYFMRHQSESNYLHRESEDTYLTSPRMSR